MSENLNLIPEAVAVFTRGIARQEDYDWRYKRVEQSACFDECRRLHASLLTVYKSDQRSTTALAVVCDPDQKRLGIVVERLSSPRSEAAKQPIETGLFCEFPFADWEKARQLAAALLGGGADDTRRVLLRYAEEHYERQPTSSAPLEVLIPMSHHVSSFWKPNARRIVRRSNPATRRETAAWLRRDHGDEGLICLCTGPVPKSRIADVGWPKNFRVVVLSESKDLTEDGEDIERALRSHSSSGRSGKLTEKLLRKIKKEVRDRFEINRIKPVHVGIGVLLVLLVVWSAFRPSSASPRAPVLVSIALVQSDGEEALEIPAPPDPVTVRIPHAENTFMLRLSFRDPVAADIASTPHVSESIRLAAAGWSTDRRTLRLTLEVTGKLPEQPANVRLANTANRPWEILAFRVLFTDRDSSSHAARD